MTLDFTTLPSPAVIEVLDFEAVLGELMADVVDRFAEAGVDYDVGNLETDPVKIILEAAAYRETLLRARINDAARSNLISFSTGSDLDHLAGFYDVVRLSGETDIALRKRVIVAISGRSTAGPSDWYRAAAMRASVRVREAVVYRVGTGPDVYISILATDNFGEPDAALLEAVRLVVTADDVRVVSDRVQVVAATAITSNVTADIWLLPDTPQSVFEGLTAVLQSAFDAQGGIGFDLTRSWLTATLHQPGVHKVVINTPSTDVVVDDHAAIKLGTVTLTYKGRDR